VAPTKLGTAQTADATKDTFGFKGDVKHAHLKLFSTDIDAREVLEVAEIPTHSGTDIVVSAYPDIGL
jgi:hypothetical protein